MPLAVTFGLNGSVWATTFLSFGLRVSWSVKKKLRFIGIRGFGVGLMSNGDIFLFLFDFLKFSNCLERVRVVGLPLHIFDFYSILFAFDILLFEIPRSLIFNVVGFGFVFGLGFHDFRSGVE